MWEKDKLLVMRNFSFSLSIFQSLVMQTHKNQGLFGKGLINSVPNDKFLDWSKLKAFADNKINATLRQKLLLGWVDNIVGKGENAAQQHFLLFLQWFEKALYLGSLKVGIVW